MPLIRAAEKLIYYAHVPKCGGTSVSAYLQDRFGPLGFSDRRYLSVPPELRWTRSSPQHVPADSLARLLPPGFVDATFTLVRHPLDRLASVFLFQRETERLIGAEVSFADWLESLPKRLAQDPFAYDNHIRPMTGIVPEGSEVFRIEEGMAPLTGWLDQITGTTFAEPVGASQLRQTRLQRDPGLDRPFTVSGAERALIATLFAEDFSRFGYDPDAPTHYAPTTAPVRAVSLAAVIPQPPADRSPPPAARLGARDLRIRGGVRQVGIAEGLAVEWKSEQVLPGADGVAVRGLRLEGVDAVEIATPAATGWIRLFCRLEKPPGAVLLGLRLLVRLLPQGGAPAARLRPMLVLTAPERGRRQTVPDSAGDLRLASGIWHEISAVFACLPEEGLAIDLVVNLPETCRVQIAALDPLWREADASDALRGSLASSVARPLAGFSATPLRETLVRHARRPVLFGAVLRPAGRQMSGWVMTDPPPLGLDLVSRAGRLSLVTDSPVEVLPGLVVPDGFRADLAALLADATEIELRCRFAAQPSRTVANLPSPLPQGRMRGEGGVPAFIGHVDRLDIDGVDGWILRSDGDPTPVDVCLLLDGQLAARSRTGLRRQDVAAFGLGTALCGFSLPLPKDFFNGRKHRIELVEACSGLRLPQGLAELQMPLEGVAFFDRRRVAIAGWSAGGHGVSICIDDGPALEVLPDLPVRGLGPANRTGFALRLPDAVVDGGWHSVKVFFTSTDVALDGAPFSVRLDAESAKVDLLSQSGDRALARISGRTGPLPDLPLRIETDDAAPQHVVSAGADDEALPGSFSFSLSSGACRVTISDASRSPPLQVARFSRAPGAPDLQPDETPDLSDLLSDKTLDAAACARATAAFDTFRAEADPASFDAPWYLCAYPEAVAAIARGEARDARQYYGALGHRLGHAPNPAFDEAGLRRDHPVLDAAVAEGRIPCVFALALLVGPGTLLTASQMAPEALAARFGRDGDTSGGMAALAESAAEPACPAALPPPTAARPIADCLYGAWLSRAKAAPDLLAALAAEEAEARTCILGQALARQPLVSILLVTRDRAPVIAEAIQTVREQSYPRWELLVCDDGSTDRTADVLREIRDPRIRHLQFSRASAGAARNGGLRLARGEYVAYLDSDTLWNPHLLDRMLRALMAAPGRALACCGHAEGHVLGSDLHLVARLLPDPALPETLALSGVLHHRRVTDWGGGFDPALEPLEERDFLQRQTRVFPLLPVASCLVITRQNVAWGAQSLLPVAAAEELLEVRARHAHLSPLSINWPERGRMTLLCGPAPEDLRLAQSLQALARPFADLALVDPGPLDGEPERLGHALFDRLEAGPVLAIGLDEDRLARLGLAGRQDLWRLLAAPDGFVLQGAARMAFPLGPLQGEDTAPEVRQRLAHALYRLLFDPPQPEVRDAGEDQAAPFTVGERHAGE